MSTYQYIFVLTSYDLVFIQKIINLMIKATKYEVEDLGRYFKTSKKKYKWYFSLENKEHYLELEFSYLSGKRKLQLDGRPLHESTMLTSSFQYPFTLEGFALNVIQQGDSFELRINNKVFSHLYTQQKTQNEFVFEDQVEDKSGQWNNNSLGNEFSEFGQYSNQTTNKFSLNLKLEKKEDESQTQSFQKKQQTTQPVAQSFGTFGNPKFEDFESFGQFGTKQPQKNPFGEFQGFNDFNGGSQQQTQNQTITPQPQALNQKVDLLDLDEPTPQPQQQQTQQTNASLFGGFDAFTQPTPQTQPQPQTVQPAATSPNLFEAFSTPPQQPAVAPNQQPSILNLYGPQQPQIAFQQQPQFTMGYQNFPPPQQQFIAQPVQTMQPQFYPQQGFQQPVAVQQQIQYDLFKL